MKLMDKIMDLFEKAVGPSIIIDEDLAKRRLAELYTYETAREAIKADQVTANGGRPLTVSQVVAIYALTKPQSR